MHAFTPSRGEATLIGFIAINSQHGPGNGYADAEQNNGRDKIDEMPMVIIGAIPLLLRNSGRVCIGLH